ncbi:phage BR0599 family protein [uncultured Jannaschia sp.]|uniref:phage BR0599 family protein n=1 Tax=uncultured Jannaschia sp. TaxID=293347 RepID=UPI00260C859F|nr:phage BR0599 family protein [uncultured Jannaschia sp.]
MDWTTSTNAGRRTEVLGHDVTDGVAVLTLLEAPVRSIAEGDTFTILAICDKRLEACRGEVREDRQLSGLPAHPWQGCRAALCHEGRRTTGRYCRRVPIYAS